MFPKNIKTTLLCGPKKLSKSFMFEAAIYWAEEGRRVVYITPEPLERWPVTCHDRSNPTVAALKLMRFIYLSNYETLVEQLVKLYTYAAVPSVLLIDDLDNYLNDEAIQNNLNEHISKTCALILHSMKLCSRVLKMNVHVCVWTSSILTNDFLQTMYFHNIWNLTEEEDGKVILLEKKVFVKSSERLYKYRKFKDEMRVLQQILCDSAEV
nr:PREDICTED: uncharacterized protein LOC105674252 isoform X2 [Linepithema humile]